MNRIEENRTFIEIFTLWIEGKRREAAELAKTLDESAARRLYDYGDDTAELGEAVFFDLRRQKRMDRAERQDD